MADVDRSAGLVRVEGARELRRTLKDASHSLDNLKDAHAAAGAIVVPEAKAGAPVVSGRLAGSVRSTGTQTAAVVRAGYASVPYAAPIHWGWAKRGIKARPFISQAAVRTQPRWLEAYHKAVQHILDKVKGANQ